MHINIMARVFKRLINLLITGFHIFSPLLCAHCKAVLHPEIIAKNNYLSFTFNIFKFYLCLAQVVF